MKHSYQHIHGRLSGEVIVLVYPGPFRSVLPPLVLNERNALRDANPGFLNPVPHLIIQGENHIWHFHPQPFTKEASILPGLADIEERLELPFFWHALLAVR